MYDKNNYFWRFMADAGFSSNDEEALKKFGFGDKWVKETLDGLREYEKEVEK